MFEIKDANIRKRNLKYKYSQSNHKIYYYQANNYYVNAQFN